MSGHADFDDRSMAIRLRLEEHFKQLGEAAGLPGGCPIGILSPDTWAGLVAAHPLTEVRWGYGYPRPVDLGPDRPGLIVGFCPEIIAGQTMHLHNDDLTAYLDAVEWMLDMHIALFDEITNPEERARQVEDRLYDEGTGHLAVISAVQAAALDAS